VNLPKKPLTRRTPHNALIPDTHPLSHDSINVDIVLSKLNLCLHDLNFDPSTFFVTHAVDSDDIPLAHKDVISHFLNGKCARRTNPGCSEVVRDVRSPIKMALTVTKAIIVQCKRNQISLDNLRTCCSAIGVTTTQRHAAHYDHSWTAMSLTRCFAVLKPWGNKPYIICVTNTT